MTSGGVARLSDNADDSLMVDVSHFVGPVGSLTGSVLGQFGANNVDRDASGNVVGFNYTSAGGIFTGASFLEIANTNATSFLAFQGALTLASPTGASASIVRSSPEPTTVLLLGSSLLALGVWRRRR